MNKIECYFCKDKLYKRNYLEHLEKVHRDELNNIITNFDQIYNSGFPIKEIEEILDMYREIESDDLSVVKEKNSVYNVKKSVKVGKWEPEDFNLEATTVWSFPDRGKWATHSGEYRGNWSPYIPRNIILRYSKKDDIVLDQFLGSGTTLVETKLLERKGIGVDINPKAIELAKNNLQFEKNEEYEPKIHNGDARSLVFIPDRSIDLICTHPPYANIIKYSDNIEGDLSLYDIDKYLNEMEKVAQESFRVLKDGKYCAILIGDTRQNKHMIPLGFSVMQVFLDVGFVLKEIIIKKQHNCRATGFWYKKSIEHNFLLIAHEYLFVFRKPNREK